MLVNRNIVVVGTGLSSEKNTTDLMENWLQPAKLDEPDTDYDFFITLPLTPISWTAGINSVLEWLEREQLQYGVIFDETVADDKEASEIAQYAAWKRDAGSEPSIDDLVTSIGEELQSRSNPTLVVLIDPDTKSEDIDPLTVEAMRMAEIYGFPVHNLSAGLIEIKLSNFESPEPPKPEPKRRTAPKEVVIEEQELTETTPAPTVKRKRRTKAQIDADNRLAEKKENPQEELQASREISAKVDFQHVIPPAIQFELDKLNKRVEELEKLNG